MPGKPGMKGEGLGGSRPGSGRKPQSFRIKLGDTLLLKQDGCEMLLGRVAEVTRRTIVIEIEKPAGMGKVIIGR